MGIELKNFIKTSTHQVDYSAVDVVNKIKKDLNAKDFLNRRNLETIGYVDATIIEGGVSWGISSLIEFSFQYTEKPFMSWGLDGTYSGDTTNTTPYANSGENFYGKNLPSPLYNYIAQEDYSTFSPAIFVPRVIHWWKKTPITYSGCYLLIAQVNPDCTEKANKTCRIHFKFSGPGFS